MYVVILKCHTQEDDPPWLPPSLARENLRLFCFIAFNRSIGLDKFMDLQNLATPSASTASHGSKFPKLTTCCLKVLSLVSFKSVSYSFQWVPPSSSIWGLGEQQFPVPCVHTEKIMHKLKGEFAPSLLDIKLKRKKVKSNCEDDDQNPNEISPSKTVGSSVSLWLQLSSCPPWPGHATNI